MASSVRVLFVLAFVLSVSGVARADLGPEPGPGLHIVQHEAFVDLGRFVDCVTWSYIVEAEDTLGEIAQRQLGRASRYREILTLNPGLNPRRLPVGEPLAMPPRSSSCDRTSPRYVFFAWTPAAGGWSMPRRLTDDPVHQIGHGARLFAVPVSRLAEVCKASGDRPLCAEALEKHPAVARSGAIRLVAHAPDEDPATRIVTKWRVASVEDGAIQLERLAEKRFDAAGRELGPRPGAAGASYTLLQVLFFLLMLACISWAVATGRRIVSERDAAGDDDDPISQVDDETPEEADEAPDAYTEADEDVE